jgi:hypothetical protein
VSRTATATESHTGHRQALSLSRTHNRLLRDGLAHLTSPLTPNPPKIRAASRTYETAIDDLLTRSLRSEPKLDSTRTTDTAQARARMRTTVECPIAKKNRRRPGGARAAA